MEKVTIKQVQMLQWRTGASVLNCTKALTETNGDFDKAVKWLKEREIL